MRVALVTPMSPQSAIADVTTQAVPDLSQYWDLDVWCPSEKTYRPCPVPVLPYDSPGPDVLEALGRYDLVVYVLGNSPWHSRILPLAHRLPGLVVVHDAALTDLVRITAIESNRLDDLADHVERQYDSEHAEIIRRATALVTPDEWLQFCAEVPLDDLAVRGSLGAVVHSRWHADRLEGLTFGDVTVAPLPVPSTRLPGEETAGASHLLHAIDDDTVLLVTVGSVNANRKIDLLLDALAGQEEFASVHLWVVGPAEDFVFTDLRDGARRRGLADRFTMTGRVTDQVLQEILSRADLAAALRDPVIEGQSASVLTQLLSGTPVIVFDHAHYSELPDDVVLKVSLDDPVTSLRACLRRVTTDRQERERFGARGRDFVLSSRGGASYAAALRSAADRAAAAIPRAHMAEDLAERLRRLGLDDESAVLTAAADLAFDLYDLD